MWFFFETFEAKTITRRLIFGILTGLTMGIYSTAWQGWWYIFDFIIGSMIAYILFLVVRMVLSRDIKKKGFMIIFTDLMADPESLISTLRALHARKHEVMIFHLLDPAERDLSFDGSIIFEDSETGELIKTEPAVIRNGYQKLFGARLNSFAHTFQNSGMDYLLLNTDTPFDKGLGSYLSWRGMFL